jgi:hypothetical protein
MPPGIRFLELTKDTDEELFSPDNRRGAILTNQLLKLGYTVYILLFDLVLHFRIHNYALLLITSYPWIL